MVNLALERDSVAIVTGAARGIGLEIASALLREGVRVAGIDVASADWSALTCVAEQTGTAINTVVVDVRSQDQVRAAVLDFADWGDVLYGVNCAGIDYLEPAENISAGSWTRVIEIDLSGVFYSCQAEFAAIQRHGRGGSIVNIASMSGSIVNRGVTHVPYTSAKAGVMHLSRSLGVEWADQHIRVNSISPGYTATEMTRRNSPEFNKTLVDGVPMKRMAEVSEIAAPVLFLLSSGAAYITAIDLLVDGGFTAW